MNALRFHTHGSPAEVLRLEPLARQPLAEGQVRLRLLAAPINPADLNMIAGTYGVHPELPATAGLEGCGEVVESCSPAFSPGDRAMFLGRAESWAEYAVADGLALFPLPPGIDPVQAAMLRVNPATAWRLLTSFTALPPGALVVQNAGNSAVGRCVITLAAHLGLKTASLVRREEYMEELISAGADHVFLDTEDAVQQLSGAGLSPSLAFNAVGGESGLRLLKMLAPGGTHITYGAMARRPLAVPARSLIFDDIRVCGFWLTRWLGQAPAREIAETYDRLAGLVLQGVIRTPVDSLSGLPRFREALQRLESPDRRGKVLFIPGD